MVEVIYNKRKYKVHQGSRGGHFIKVKGEKRYIDLKKRLASMKKISSKKKNVKKNVKKKVKKRSKYRIPRISSFKLFGGSFKVYKNLYSAASEADKLSSVEFSPCGEKILLVKNNGAIKIWDSTIHRVSAPPPPPGGQRQYYPREDVFKVTYPMRHPHYRPVKQRYLPSDRFSNQSSQQSSQQNVSDLNWNTGNNLRNLRDMIGIKETDITLPIGSRSVQLGGVRGNVYMMSVRENFIDVHLLSNPVYINKRFDCGRSFICAHLNPQYGLIDKSSLIAGVTAGDVYMMLSHNRVERFIAYDKSSGKVPKNRSVNCVRFSNCSNMFASACSDGTVGVWKLNSKVGNFVPTYLKGYAEGPNEGSRSVKSVAFSPDNNYLASAGVNGQIRLWRIDELTNSACSILEGHSGQVNSVVFSSDSKMIVSAGEDKMMRVWNVNDSSCVEQLNVHSHPVKCAQFHPLNNNFIISSDEENALISAIVPASNTSVENPGTTN